MKLNKVSSSHQVKLSKIRVSRIDCRMLEKTSLEFSLLLTPEERNRPESQTRIANGLIRISDRRRQEQSEEDLLRNKEKRSH